MTMCDIFEMRVVITPSRRAKEDMTFEVIAVDISVGLSAKEGTAKMRWMFHQNNMRIRGEIRIFI